jgi:aryl-alcohol dehydrogenase-like predicted oxidoreductase
MHFLFRELTGTTDLSLCPTQNLEKVEKIRKIAGAKQTDVAHVVLAWYLTGDFVIFKIIAIKRKKSFFSLHHFIWLQ